MTPGGFSCTPQNPKIHHFSSLPLGVQENRNTISVRSASSILLGLDREFEKLFRFSFCCSTVLAFLWNRPSHQSDTTRSACLRSLGTAQVTSHDHCCSTASQLVESCVLSTRDAIFVVYTPISCRESHHLVVSFTPTSSRSIRIGVCLPLCASVSVGVPQNHRHSHTRQHGQISRSLARWRS